MRYFIIRNQDENGIYQLAQKSPYQYQEKQGQIITIVNDLRHYYRNKYKYKYQVSFGSKAFTNGKIQTCNSRTVRKIRATS